MNKKLYKSKDVRDKILSGIDFITNPVVQTISPRGSNVLFETERGDQILTNDGVTIAKNVNSADQIEDAVIEIIKEAALRTNNEAGDGTSTTILFSSILAKESLKLIDEGHSWIEIKDELKRFATQAIKIIEKNKIDVVGNKGLREVATISANNDSDIADKVVEAVNVAGLDGMIFLEPNRNGPETELVKDLGYMVKSGILYQDLLTDNSKPVVVFKDAPVLLTDKKIYHSEEAESILRVAVKAGYKEVVVVARDFIGNSVNTFIANHTKGIIKVMLVKADVDEKNTTMLADLATYLVGHVVSEKTGSLVNNVTEDDFVIVNQVYSDPQKTLFTPKVAQSKALKERIRGIKDELEKDKDNEELKSRLASLTTGVVTLKIGGITPMEAQERVFRHEDAINATRSAIRHGYLVGGGKSVLSVLDSLDCPNKDFLPMFKKVCEAPLRQIAFNCGKHEDTIVERVRAGGKNFGYNALADDYGDILKAGVVDPFLVIKMALENSVSVATIIISINNFLINDLDNYDKEKERNK